MSLNFTPQTPREEVFDQAEAFIRKHDFIISDVDDMRPWGGFFVIGESEASRFIEAFFPHLTMSDVKAFTKLSPKILLVEPDKRLSWQYHHRRAEIWKVIGGEAGVIVSPDDQQRDVQKLTVGDIVELKQGERHRLVGLENWGIVAEIWKHTDPNYPSDENDIVRVEDDFGR